jgi:hypothetical protein
MNGTAAASVTVNGALTQSTTLVIDTLSGAALAVGQVVTVNGAGGTPAASITDADGNTGISTDNSLTITAVASVTTCTVSEPITVANDIVLLTSTNGGDEVVSDGISMTVAGPTFASSADVTLIARTGETLGGDILLEQGAQDTGRDTLVMDASDGSSTDENDQIDLEDKTSGIATYVQAGSTNGTAYVLNGITVAAA